MCESAIEDAKINANNNNIKNCNFICNKVENILENILLKKTEYLSKEENNNLVAIVDPPRCGLHPNVIKSLRKCKSINKIIYVSCNPTESLMNNLEDLCVCETSTLKGKPYYPVKCVGVDLFPHTNHCEMIMLFNRI